MSKKVQVIAFYILMFGFTLCYWSFFPGAYSPDSYFTYLNSLGIVEYLDVVSPIYSLNWKITNYYNFGPLLINYLVFVAATILSIRFTKNYYIAIFSLIAICFPYTLITYVFAWKDNALLTMLFLAAILSLNKNKSTFYTVITLITFFIAFTLRLNAVFAIIPLLYYFLSNRHSRRKSLILTALFIVGFQITSIGINKLIFNSKSSNHEQTLMFTDIAKINYWQKKDIADGIPEEFLRPSNLNSENVDKMFELYCGNSCNDNMYMTPEWKGGKYFLRMNDNEDALSKLKRNWLSKVVNNPFTYLKIRIGQLNNALWVYTIHYYSPVVLDFSEDLFSAVAGNKNTSGFDRNSKVFQPMTNDFVVNLRNLISEKSEFKDLVSHSGLYLIFSVILFTIFAYNRKKNNFYRLGIYLSLSGILYTIGYLPILPCTDYRYFIWTIFSFWLSMGVLVIAITNRETVRSDKTDKLLPLDAI